VEERATALGKISVKWKTGEDQRGILPIEDKRKKRKGGRVQGREIREKNDYVRGGQNFVKKKERRRIIFRKVISDDKVRKGKRGGPEDGIKRKGKREKESCSNGEKEILKLY